MNRQHQTAAYLIKASNFLPNNAEYSSIRSNLITKYMEHTRRTPDVLNRCKACGVNFKDVLPMQQIQPAPTLNRFMRRHFRDEYCKTKYQALRMKQFHKKLYNQQNIVTVCKICNKSCTTKVTKLPKIHAPKTVVQMSRKENKILKKKLKRLQKLKGREFAGLSETAVLSVANDLKNNSASTSVICLDDTVSPERSSVRATTSKSANLLDDPLILISDTTTSKNANLLDDSLILNSDATTSKGANLLDDSHILISDSPATISSELGKELTGNDTDASVIVVNTPTSSSNPSDSNIFFIDTTPTPIKNPKKFNKPAVTHSFKTLNAQIKPITPSVTRTSLNANINQVNNKQTLQLSKKQRKLLKISNNSNLNSTSATNTSKPTQLNAGKKKNNRKIKKNKILAQTLKKVKKNQKQNLLANLLNSNNDSTRVKSTSMLTEFLKSVR